MLHAPPQTVAIVAAAAEQTPKPAVVPAGTVLAVALSETVDSAKAKPGDIFHFETIDPLKIDGRVVLPAHARGVGIVSDAQAAGAHSRPGSLLLEARFVQLPGGGQLQVTVDRKVTDLQRMGVSPSLPFYTSYLPIPGLGLLTDAYKYLLNGKNVVLQKGTIFVVVTIQATTVPERAAAQR